MHSALFLSDKDFELLSNKLSYCGYPEYKDLIKQWPCIK